MCQPSLDRWVNGSTLTLESLQHESTGEIMTCYTTCNVAAPGLLGMGKLEFGNRVVTEWLRQICLMEIQEGHISRNHSVC